MQELIERIMGTVEKKKVQGLCKKILKKCSFKSKVDLSNVISLALWLYVYECFDDAIAVCDLLTDLEFTGDYTLWDYTDYALCLKARIMREQGNFEGREMLLQKVNEHRHPELYANLLDWYKTTLNKNIASDDEYHSPKTYAGWRLVKLRFAIQHKEAGGYPISDEEFENDIQEMIHVLKQIK